MSHDHLPECSFSKRVRISSILDRPDGGSGLDGQTIRVGGWVKTGRLQRKKTMAFVELNDGSCLSSLQLVIDKDVGPLEHYTPTGTSLLVEGVLKLPPQDKQRKQTIELVVVKVLKVGPADPDKYPLPKTALTLEELRKRVHLRPRTDTISAVARIRHALASATHTFFGQHGFLYIQTPIITTSDCEGSGEMFQVTTLLNDAEKVEKAKPGICKKDGKIDYAQDFFGRQSFLTVSGQLQLETYACALSDVYTFGPTFRAENSHTPRHLAEFWMVETEIAFADLKNVMDLAEGYVRFLCQWLLDNCLDDLEFMVEKFDKNATMVDKFDKNPIDRLKLVASNKFIRRSYTEAVAILEEASKEVKFDNKVEWGIDLTSEHERYLTEVKYKSPVIVYDYPKDIKAFYMKVNPDNKTVAAMDVLLPKVGELIGGSQREECLDVLKERMLDMGMPLEPYEWYLDLRRYGTVEHSGFGLGFERMILFATGIDNIRDVIPFPRYPRKADL